MGTPLESLTIHGFKSIAKLENFAVDKNLNVLIGANGSGKSNFVDFFRLLRALADQSFQIFVNEQGGGDGFLYLGPKKTPRITAHLEFGNTNYAFTLEPTASGTLQVKEEQVKFIHEGFDILSSGAMESALKDRKNDRALFGSGPGVPSYVHQAVASWMVYHFHDTSPLSQMRRDQSVRDWEQFRHDASNIAPFLMNLKQTHPGSYQLIRDTVRLVAPFLDDFLLRSQMRGTNEMVRLEWHQKGSDFPFQPNHLSDGTIRFICLATALLQPVLPATIVIDEPELGLHPYAIAILADLIQSASERTQVIVTTQSPTLLDYFAPEQIVVVNRRKGRSTFERLDAQALAGWIEEYSVGELWQKNVIQGGPSRE